MLCESSLFRAQMGCIRIPNAETQLRSTHSSSPLRFREGLPAGSIQRGKGDSSDKTSSVMDSGTVPAELACPITSVVLFQGVL